MKSSTFDELYQQIFGIFAKLLKLIDLIDWLIIKIIADTFSVDQLID